MYILCMFYRCVYLSRLFLLSLFECSVGCLSIFICVVLVSSVEECLSVFNLYLFSTAEHIFTCQSIIEIYYQHYYYFAYSVLFISVLRWLISCFFSVLQRGSQFVLLCLWCSSAERKADCICLFYAKFY